MAKLILNGSTSGSVTLESPAVSGTTTLTLPTTSGTVITTGSTFGGTGPAFSATTSSTLSISTGTNTKIPFNTEDWDTNSNYDNVTNYRFTPTIAGYYQVNIKIQLDNTGSGGETYTAVYKNGSIYKRVGMVPNIASTGRSPVGSVNVYLNGSTDYVEAYVFQNTGGSVALTGNTDFAYFQAAMIRSA